MILILPKFKRALLVEYLHFMCKYLLCVSPILYYYNFFLNIFGEPNRGSFFYYMQCECCACVVCICELTQQVHIGRRTTCQGCETNFLSLGPDVISLTSI